MRCQDRQCYDLLLSKHCARISIISIHLNISAPPGHESAYFSERKAKQNNYFLFVFGRVLYWYLISRVLYFAFFAILKKNFAKLKTPEFKSARNLPAHIDNSKHEKIYQHCNSNNIHGIILCIDKYTSC